MDLSGWTGAEPAERADPTGRRRDLRLALSCLGGGLLLLVLGVYDQSGWGSAWSLTGPLAVLSGALLLRRVAPVPGLLVGTGAVLVDYLLGPSLGTVLVFTQLLYDTALYGRRWLLPWLLRLAVVVTAALTLAAFAWAERAYAVGLGVTLTLVLVMPVVTAEPVRRHRDRARLERERAEQIARRAELDRRRAELDRREAVAAERARMARELHDVVANHFSAVAIHATAALSLPGLDRDRVREMIAVMRDSSVRGLAEMRHLVELLRDPGDGGAPAGGTGPVGERPMGERPGLAGLDHLVAATPGLPVRLDRTGSPRDLPPEVDLAAYRIVQESLTNAGRYAAGGRAGVCVAYRPDELVLTVDSWGPATAADPPVRGAGLGLAGMRERAALLGGVVDAGPHGDGWRVRARLPLPAEAGPS